MINLKEIRTSQKLTQQELANLLWMKQQQYKRYENEINAIPLKKFLKMLEFCGYQMKIIKK